MPGAFYEDNPSIRKINDCDLRYCTCNCQENTNYVFVVNARSSVVKVRVLVAHREGKKAEVARQLVGILIFLALFLDSFQASP